MRVLIFHGYLLRGTGSNVYNASLAQALARIGHEVHLFCQDREAESLPWVDAVGTWSDGALEVRREGAVGPGSITVYRPDIGGLLPVYVHDSYAGFEARTFAELTEAEIAGYVAANMAAVHDVIALTGEPDAALANHLVMGPVILARAGLRFAAKIHGSALSYTVKPDLERFGPFAREGMAAAATVLVGSRHTGEDLWRTLAMDGLAAKTRLGPPGVDLEAFAPLPEGADPGAHLNSLAARVSALDRATAQDVVEGEPETDSFDRAVEDAAEALAAYAAAGGPRVIFVGKTIVSKGCDLLLAAWPIVHASAPGARLLIAGFGAYRPALEALWRAIGAGDLEAAQEIASRGRGLEGGAEDPLRILSAFLTRPPRSWLEAARGASSSVSFSGRLEHAEVAEAVRASDAMVVPSTFPEAFGMVAAEAAAAGVLPVCADHSGLAEVADRLDRELPAAAGGLTAFPVDEGAIESIAARVVRWLDLSPPERAEAQEAMRRTVGRLWSWEGVAGGVLAAARGELDALPEVPAG